MSRISCRCVLIICLVLFSWVQSGCSQTTGGNPTPRSTAPTFVGNVPSEVRQLVTSLLTAYERGDEQAVFSLLKTEAGGPRPVTSFNTIQIPIMNPKVKVSEKNKIVIEYETSHPGDIIAAILAGKEDIREINKKLVSLKSAPTVVRRSETWSLVSEGDTRKIDYGGNGILQLANLFGRNVFVYAEDPAFRELSDKPLGDRMSMRTVALISYYFMSYNLKADSPDGKRLTRDIFAKVKGVIGETTREIVQPTYSLWVPSSWQNVQDFLDEDKKAEGVVAYAGKTGTNNAMGVIIKEELDARKGEFSKYQDEMLLILAFALVANQAEDKVKIIDRGESQIGGIPAKYPVSIDKSEEKNIKKLLIYVFVKDKIIYSMSFVCSEAEFDANYEKIIKIKDSFQFRKKF